MPSYNTYSQRLLVCTSSPDKINHLETRMLDAGYEIECVTQAGAAKKRLWQENYCGIAIDLLLADQDGISFAREIRQQHPWLPVLVLNTEAGSESIKNRSSDPDWLQNTTAQARLIFALKQASIRSSGQQTCILHIEEDDNIARLVRNTLGEQVTLFRARTIQEAKIALALREYDFTLVNSQRPIIDALVVRELSKDQLVIENKQVAEPLLTVLDNMRRYSGEHQPAYC